MPERLFLWLLGAQYGVHYYILPVFAWFRFDCALLFAGELFVLPRKTSASRSLPLLSAGGYLLVLLLTARVGIQWVLLAMIAATR